MKNLLMRLVALIVVLSINGSVFAALNNKPQDAFWVSPVESVIKMIPWWVKKETITIFNTTSKELSVEVSLVDVFYNKEWKIVNMPDNIDENNPEHQRLLRESSIANLPKVTLKDWVWYTESIFNIWPNSEKEFSFMYTIPKSAKNWPHWWRFVFVAKESNSKKTIIVQKAAAVNLIVRVEDSPHWNETTMWESLWEVIDSRLNLTNAMLGDILVLSYDYKTTWDDFAYPKWSIAVKRKQSNWEYINLAKADTPLFRAFPNSIKSFSVELNKIKDVNFTLWNYLAELNIEDLKGWSVIKKHEFVIDDWKSDEVADKDMLIKYWIWAVIFLLVLVILILLFRRKKTKEEDTKE